MIIQRHKDGRHDTSIDTNITQYFPSVRGVCVFLLDTCRLSHLKWTSNFLWLTFPGSARKKGVRPGASFTLGCVCVWCV